MAKTRIAQGMFSSPDLISIGPPAAKKKRAPPKMSAKPEVVCLTEKGGKRNYYMISKEKDGKGILLEPQGRGNYVPTGKPKQIGYKRGERQDFTMVKGKMVIQIDEPLEPQVNGSRRSQSAESSEDEETSVSPRKNGVRATRSGQKAAGQNSDQKKPPKIPVSKSSKAIKKAPLKKKKSLILDRQKSIQHEEKLQKQRARDIAKLKREAARNAKINKQKLLEIEPNPKVPALQVNPILSPDPKTKEFPLEGCSAFSNNRRALWAVANGDVDGLKRCLKDTENISNPFQPFSKHCPLTIFDLALKHKNPKLLDEILNYLK